MTEAQIQPLAVFRHDNLPAHPANVYIKHPDHEVEWPASATGVAFMPMSGQFLVQDAMGALAECEDGYLTVGEDGYPRWSAAPPG